MRNNHSLTPVTPAQANKRFRSRPYCVIHSAAGSSQLTMHIMILNGLTGQTRPRVSFSIMKCAGYKMEPSMEREQSPEDPWGLHNVCECVRSRRQGWLQPSGHAETHLERCYKRREMIQAVMLNWCMCQHLCVCSFCMCV